MASCDPACFLFVPASGPAGAGEYMRCRILAAAIERYWANARIHFVLNRHASYAQECPYPTRLLETSPAHATESVNAYISEIKPDIVIFDSTGRAKQLAAAQRAGAHCVFVSSRPNARRKGLRWNRIRHLDQHWIPQPEWAAPSATSWERLKKRWFANVQTLHFAALFEDSEPARRLELLRELGIEGQRYVAFCAGGGGSFKGRPQSAQIMLEAATGVAREAGLTCAVVLGPNYDGPPAEQSNVISISRLSNANLMDLLHDADVVATGGGSVLMQALALHKPCVAFPIAGDQPERIQRCAERKLLVPAALDAADIARATVALLDDAASRARLAHDLEKASLVNGVQAAIGALERLLARGN